MTYVFPTVEYARIRPTASPANQATTLTTMSASLLAPQENTLPQILTFAMLVHLNALFVQVQLKPNAVLARQEMC